MKTNKAENIQTPEQAKASEEEIKHNKAMGIKRINLNLRCIQRELAYKKEQKENTTEMFRLENTPGQSPVLLTMYPNEKKPKFLIENEIDQLEYRLDELEEQKKIMES